MSKFRVVTPKGASFTVAGGGYAFEKEAVDPRGGGIAEAPANEAEFIAAARTADAIYAKGIPISKKIIDALENCKVITLGSVGVDSVDVKAATARGIPVTNIPDTFIEEVADHAMMLWRAAVHHLLGAKHFKQMKPSAIFINTGRGATVNEEALIKALQEGWIAHAALDVLEKEPPSHNNPMLGMENVTLTAHVASASARFDEARKRRVGYELSLVLSGMWPVSCVHPSVLQNTALRRWQPVSFVPADEEVCRGNAKKFADKTGVEVKVDFVGWEDINQQTAVTSNSGAGPDIIIGFGDAPHIYVDKLIELSDVADYLGKRYGGWAFLAEKKGKRRQNNNSNQP